MPKNDSDNSPPVLLINVADNIQVNESIRLRGKREGRKKPTSAIVSEDDFHRDSKEWRHIDRVIDFENDHYAEIIKDKEGKIVRHCREPLTKHRGRGSAKETKDKCLTAST